MAKNVLLQASVNEILLALAENQKVDGISLLELTGYDMLIFVQQ